jgi:Uma2 family endonuclease
LIVEVISPGSEKRDKGYKRKLYERHGVKEFWLVEPHVRAIEVYILTDGVYELDNVYRIPLDYEWDMMSDEEKAEVAMSFKTSIFDDLVISVEEVFENV